MTLFGMPIAIKIPSILPPSPPPTSWMPDFGGSRFSKMFLATFSPGALSSSSLEGWGGTKVPQGQPRHVIPPASPGPTSAQLLSRRTCPEHLLGEEAWSGARTTSIGSFGLGAPSGCQRQPPHPLSFSLSEGTSFQPLVPISVFFRAPAKAFDHGYTHPSQACPFDLLHTRLVPLTWGNSLGQFTSPPSTCRPTPTLQEATSRVIAMWQWNVK